jgi:hypothetical protein
MRPVFVIGKAQHGKSIFRTALASALGVKGASCSDAIYVVWSLISGVGESELRLRPKQEVRHLLVALGDWLTTSADSYEERFPRAKFPDADISLLDQGKLPRPGPSALIQWSWMCDVRVLDGIRREAELDAAREPLEWAGVPARVVWIEKPGAPDVPGDNFSIPLVRAERVFVNGGTIEDLQEQARKFAKEIQVKSDSDA